MKPENPYLNNLLNSLESQDEDQMVAQLQEMQQEAGFSPGFADRVMEQIDDEQEEANVFQHMPRMFRWVAIAGVAAAAVLLAMFVLDGDSISIDAMSGLAEMSLADELTLEMY